jgi:nicotinamide riboside transporter PnuC
MIILDALASLSSLIAAWHASSHSRSTWIWTLFAASINFILYLQAGVYGHAALDLWYITIALL